MKKHVVSFSGGRTSAYMTLEVLKLHPDATVVFMDTGAEHPLTYLFIREVAERWNIEIVCLRLVNLEMGKGCSYEVVDINDIGPDLVPWKRMLQKYGHPYVGGAFCTDRMKTRPFKKYCDDQFGKNNYITWLGIRVDEPKRLGFKPGFGYLAEISDFEKSDILDWWSKQPFDLMIPEHLGNCVFCIKKSLMKVSLAARDAPYLAQGFMEMIEENDIKEDRVMYRNKQSLGQVIAMFSDISREDLTGRMLSMKKYDTGSCSESCEAFSLDDDK